MAIDPKLLEQLLGVHPARRLRFDDLYAGLQRGVEEKRIHVSRDGDLELFGYSSVCQFEQQWDLFSLIARGLVIDRAERRVVATPFPKFFNFGEAGAAIPAEPFEATEKMDGSLGTVFYHRGAWRITTRGQLRSAQGQWATRHLHENAKRSELSPGTTYLVEIVYSDNRIVIHYPFEGLVLLAAYDAHGVELDRAALADAAGRAGWRLARAAAYESFDQLLLAARSLGMQEEGFVVRFQSGLRIKLKGEAYCRIHHLICRCTPLALWEAMMNNDDLDSMRRELPEEMRTDFDAIRRLLDARAARALGEIRAGHAHHLSLSDRDLGLLSQGQSGLLTEIQRKFIFACRNKSFLDLVHGKGEWRDKFFKTFRPDRNHLDGYTPSSAMNRFADELTA